MEMLEEEAKERDRRKQHCTVQDHQRNEGWNVQDCETVQEEG